MLDEKQNHMKDLGTQLAQLAQLTPEQRKDFLTIQLVSQDTEDKADLEQYLKKTFEVPVYELLTESVEDGLRHVAVCIYPVLVPVATYVGQKFIDALMGSLRTWILTRRHVQEVILYGPDEKIITKIPGQ